MSKRTGARTTTETPALGKLVLKRPREEPTTTTNTANTLNRANINTTNKDASVRLKINLASVLSPKEPKKVLQEMEPKKVLQEMEPKKGLQEMERVEEKKFDDKKKPNSGEGKKTSEKLEELPVVFSAVPMKRRVGRPTKAESLARLAAKGIDINQYLASQEAARQAKREAKLHTKKTPEERVAEARQRQLNLIAAVTDGTFKRRRGRPSKEELRLRSLRGVDGRVDASIVAELIRPLEAAAMATAVQAVLPGGNVSKEQRAIDAAWEPEVRSLLEGSRYGETDADQLLPLVMVFADEANDNDYKKVSDFIATTADGNDEANLFGPEAVAHECATLFEHFHTTSARIDSAMGCTELSVLDQRLCLEEEKFLLNKLQRSISSNGGSINGGKAVSVPEK